DKALVWLGMGDGVTSAFISAVQPFIGNPKVYGFYLVDEPDPTGKWAPLVTAPNLKAESDWIHANDPGALTFIVLMNMGTETNPSFANTYNSANTGIDLFGLDPYPVQKQFNGANYNIIAATVTAAEAWGIKLSQIVPVYQAFGDGTTWVMPTASQEQQILATWAPLVPQPAFDYAYSWGVQNNDTALVGSSSLQAVFAAHNAAQVSLPAAPSNLTASAVSTSEIDLAWTNNAGSASGFVVNRSTDGVNFSQLAVLGNVTSFKDTGLSAGSKCYYEVAATNAAGSSAFSNVA